MKIQLKNTRVEKFNFISSDEIKKDSFSLGVANGYSEKDSNSFIVKFEVEVKSEHGYRFELSFIAEFETDSEVSTEFKSSHFPVVNAPAIAYPYLRSFVSLVTLNSGYEPLILPTVNFQVMAKEDGE